MKKAEQRGRLKAKEEIEQKLAQHGKGPKGKKITSVLVDVALWQQFRMRCLEENRTASEALEFLMTGFLKGDFK